MSYCHMPEGLYVQGLSCGQQSKEVLLQAWGGPEGSRKLRFPDFMTMAQDGGKISCGQDTGKIRQPNNFLILTC